MLNMSSMKSDRNLNNIIKGLIIKNFIFYNSYISITFISKFQYFL